MKLTVLTWLRDEFIGLLGKTIELTFRLILLILPMGIFLFLVQSREKASSVRTLPNYTNDNSRWQHIFPGFMLVAVNPDDFKNSYSKIKINIQSWINGNRYILSFIFMALIVILMLVKG